MAHVSKHLRSWAGLAVQIGVVFAGLAWLHLAPSSPGNMLLIPLTDDARRHLPALAVDEGALLLRQGPWAGSLVVRADRHLRADALLGAAVLPLAAPEWLCGRAAKGDWA